MAQQLLKMATDEDVSDSVKLAAIRDALDRAGLGAKTAVEVSVGPPKPYEQILGVATVSRAESRARRGVPEDAPPAPRALTTGGEPEVVEAEVVPDPPGNRPSWAADESAATDRPSGWEPPPGNGLMTLEQANAEIARANRESGEYPTRPVRYE